MSENNKNENNASLFKNNLPAGFKTPESAVGQKILREYGALLIARGGAIPPKTVIFKNETEVFSFQKKLPKAIENLGGFNIELQTAAMQKLQAAIIEAEENNLSITPRGADAGKRNYQETVELWASRVDPGLTYWVGAGKLSEAQASRIRRLSPFDQVPEILKLETEGIFFSKDLSKSIVYSVAPPGTSQHLSMLALDVCEHGDENVREILAEHFWFQTVISDLPHFTFLGVPERQLSDLGLKKIYDAGRAFWLPNL